MYEGGTDGGGWCVASINSSFYTIGMIASRPLILDVVGCVFENNGGEMMDTEARCHREPSDPFRVTSLLSRLSRLTPPSSSRHPSLYNPHR